MKLQVNPASFLNALDLINKKVDIITVGLSDFSTRNNCILNEQQLEEIINLKQQTKIYVLVNKFFFEQEIQSLEKHLIYLSKLNVDGIIFNDFAIPQIIKEKQLNFNLSYNPETLVVNEGQFEFYIGNNIKNVRLPNELYWTEIQKIIANKNGMQLTIQCSGYAFIMHSRWNLISNFTSENNIESLLMKKLFLQEELRKEKMLIYEDKDGTHIFSNYNICLLEKINELWKLNVDILSIESFLHDEEWINNQVNIYQSAIMKLNESSFISEEQIKNLIDQNPNNEKYSLGFLGSINDLPYLIDPELTKDGE